MATKKRRKCPKGFRRDGTCRKTKCPRKLTKKRLCPKGATHGGSRKKKGKKRGKTDRQKLIASLVREAKQVLSGGSASGSGSGFIGGSRIGFNRLFGTRRAPSQKALDRYLSTSTKLKADRKESSWVPPRDRTWSTANTYDRTYG